MSPTYFSRLRAVIRSSIVGEVGGIQDSVQVFTEQGKLWTGASKFSHSACHRRSLHYVVGTFYIPSISGQSFQVSGCHIDCALCGRHEFSAGRKFQNKTMASQSSRIVVGEFSFDNVALKRGYHSQPTKNTSNLGLTTSLGSDRVRDMSMSMKNHQQPHKHNRAICNYIIHNVAKSLPSFYPCRESGCRDLHSSSSSFTAVPAHDISYSPREEHVTYSSDSSEWKTPSGKTLKLISGSCYLPHPDKEETGGEDAHFICSKEQAIGVADGVGGWAEFGVDAGQYSRELMSNSVDAIQEEPEGSIDPARVLEKAHSSTKAKGSSTACIIVLNDKGLQAINLGDSGFMVVRGGCTIFRSPVQQHNFNFTYQLESGNSGDLPSSGQVFTVPVVPGDVIIVGTDGLFDNLYKNEIIAVVVHAIRAGLTPQVTAQKIAALARQRAQDKDRQTPFSTAAQDAGIRYYGGKLDDTTVVVSYIISSENA